MKRILAIGMIVLLLAVPATSLAIDLDSLGLGSLSNLLGGNESEKQDVKIDPADIPNGVSYEFYEKMTILEAFYDEYHEFLLNYNNSKSNALLLMDYLDMVAKSVEMDKALDDIDEKKLTKEEDDYYIKVLLRINQKQLEILELLQE